MTEIEQRDFDKMTADLDRSKQAQGGSDRAVMRLQGELADLKKQLEGTVTEPVTPPTTAPAPEKQTTAENLEKAVELQNRRESVFKLALEHGVDPSAALTLLGLDDSDDVDRIAVVDQIRQTERNSVLKENGRTPGGGLRLKMEPLDLAAINAMPESEIKKLPPALVDDALTKHIDELKAEHNPSTRKRLTQRLFGGK